MAPIDTPSAGRREWIGLSVLALACLLYVMDLTVLRLAVPSMLRTVGSGADREAAQAEGERNWQNQRTPDHDRTQPRPGRTAIPAAEA
jgi:hypothetical protein